MLDEVSVTPTNNEDAAMPNEKGIVPHDEEDEEEIDISSFEEQKFHYVLVFKQHVTLLLIATVTLIAVVAIIAAAAVPASANAIKDIVTSVAPQMVAIVSLVVGYFFGRNRRF